MTTGREPLRTKSGARIPTLAVAVPDSELVARALPRVDWSDAFAVECPGGPAGDPRQWADAIFGPPPVWVRALFLVRETLVRLIGIERGPRNAFATVASRDDEVLVGADQKHLSFRASVLLEPSRVVLSTLVQVHNRRGWLYSAVVRRFHPAIVRAMLAGAARELAAGA